MHDRGGHRTQGPHAQGRTCAKQDQAQVAALGKTQQSQVDGGPSWKAKTRQHDAGGGWRMNTARERCVNVGGCVGAAANSSTGLLHVVQATIKHLWYVRSYGLICKHDYG